MNTKKVLFESSKITFGLAHLALQSAADLCTVAETSVAHRLGYIQADQKEEYKEVLRERTSNVQANIKLKAGVSIEQVRAAFNKKKLV